MADYKPKYAPTQAFQDAMDQKGYNNTLMSGLVGAADSATFGYLPKIISSFTNVPEEAASKIIRATQNQHPTASALGSGAGYIYDGLAALAAGGMAATAGAGTAIAGGVTAARPVLAALAPYAKAAVKPALSGLGLMAGGMTLRGMLGANDPEYVAQEAADQQKAAEEKAKADTPAPKKMTANEFWGAQLGVRPEDVDAITKKYGGIPLAMAQGLNQMKGRPVNYREQAFGGLMQALDAQAADVMQNGTPEQQAAFRTNYAKLMAQIMGVDPLGQSLMDQMGGEEQ